MTGQDLDLSGYHGCFETIDTAHAQIESGERHLHSFEVAPAKWRRFLGAFGDEYPCFTASRNLQGHFTDKRIILEYGPLPEPGSKASGLPSRMPGVLVEFDLKAMLGKASKFIRVTLASSSEAEGDLGSPFAVSLFYSGIERFEHDHLYGVFHPVWRDAPELRRPLFSPYPTDKEPCDVDRCQIFAHLIAELLATYSSPPCPARSLL